MQQYMLEVFGKCSFEKRNYIIFDQLNPSFSKYFKQKELMDLLKDSGFKNVNRHMSMEGGLGIQAKHENP